MKKATFVCLLSSLFLLLSCNNSTPSTSGDVCSQSQSTEATTIEREISLLPNHQVDAEIENDGGSLDVSIQDESLIDVVVRNKNRISIIALAEGSTTVRVSAGRRQYVFSVQCIDLRIANEESYVENGRTLQINLSKNVAATYEIDNEDVATVDENGLIRALKEGIFELKVKYKDIVLSRVFDTYVRKSEIDVFNRKNPLVHYLGRNYHANKKVRMDNEGSGFEVYFEGTELKAILSGNSSSWYGYTMVSVLVDDEIDTTKRVVTLNRSSKEAEYVLVNNLTPGFHRVRVMKRTENLSTYMTLVKLATDGKFHPVNKGDVLKMEVYGDSITAGYGNLRGDLDDQTSAVYQSGLQTYASYTALELGAELNIQARTGIGMYTANNSIGTGNHVKDHFDKVSYDGQYYWNFDNYHPDVVLINLGTNDYWDTRFNEQTFLDSYCNTVNSLASLYGAETAFVFLSGLMEQEVNAFVLKAKDRLTSLSNPIYTYQFSRCEGGHPLYGEHAKASDELIKLIKENHLDAIRSEHETERIVPESQGETVTSVTTVKLLDQIKEDSVLYANIGTEKRELTKISPFVYQLALPARAEGDLDVTFTIDDNEEYTSDHYTIHVRKNFSDEVVLDTFLAAPIDEDLGECGWTISNHLFDETVTVIDESNIVVMNTNWLAGLVVRDSNEGDDLKISATIRFDHAIEDYTQAFAGLVPYYLDDNNFVTVYLQWDSAGSIRGLGCTGIIEGRDIGWNDFFSVTGFVTNPTAGIDLAVTRNGSSLTAECGGKTETKHIAGMSGDTEKVGTWNYCADNAVTYANFTETHQDAAPEEATWEFTSHLFDGTMTVNAANNVTLYNNGNWMAGFAVKETSLTDNYYISATLTCASDNFAASDDVTLGLLPYYVNDNNFVVVYLQWTDSRVIKSMGCTGRINGADLGWNDEWGFANVQSTLASGQTMKVMRQNTRLTVEYGGKSGTITLSKLSGMENSFCGLYSNKTATTFSDIVIASV